MGCSILHEPVYGVTEAARLLKMTPNRVRRWLFGYEYEWNSQGNRKRGRQPPVVERGESAATRSASFLDLMELLFAKAFLDHGISLSRVRRALDEAKRHFREDHPFARQRFYAWKRDIYMQLGDDEDSTLVQLLHGGQLAIRPIIQQVGKQIDFDSDTHLATTWWPLGRRTPVVLAPRICFGSPCVQGRGIRTANVYDLFCAENRDVKQTCFWLDLSPHEVHAAVQFEERLVVAA